MLDKLSQTQQLRLVIFLLLGFVVIGLGLIRIADSDEPESSQLPEQMQSIAEQESVLSAPPASSDSDEASQMPSVNQPAPDFSFRGVAGASSVKDLAGSPVVLEFIATWCPHCENMAPRFESALKGHDEIEYLTIGVAGESLKKVRSWHEKLLGHPMPGQAGIDDQGQGRQAYGVNGTPTTAFIDSDGILRQLHTGEMTIPELQEALSKISD